MDSNTQRQMEITGVFPENRGRGLMQLEDAHIVEITKNVGICIQQGKSTNTNY